MQRFELLDIVLGEPNAKCFLVPKAATIIDLREPISEEPNGQQWF